MLSAIEPEPHSILFSQYFGWIRNESIRELRIGKGSEDRKCDLPQIQSSYGTSDCDEKGVPHFNSLGMSRYIF